MFSCLLTICLLQTPSHIPERTDFIITDTVKNETLTVEWINSDMTKNTIGDKCWLYDGEAEYPCNQ